MLTADEKIGVAAVVVTMALAGADFLFPAWHWFEVDRVEVLAAVEGQPVPMEYSRDIKRPFVGDWRVKVWRAEGDEWLPVCATPVTRETYEPGTKLPDPVTLEWFAYTDPDCYRLEAGDYQMEVVWTINPGSVWEREVVRRDTFRSAANEG